MNRREFFGTAAGVAALASTRFGWAAQAVDPKADWKKVRQSTLDRMAIMTLNFQSILKVPDTQPGPARTLELADIGEMLADTYGVHKVEFQHYHLASVEPSYFKDMRTRLEKSKSRATQINLEFSGLNISAPQNRDRLLAIDLTKMWIDHAVTLGAQRVMINQGQPTQENKVHSIPTLKAMVDYGKSKNIIVSVETRGSGGGGGRGRGGQGGQAQVGRERPRLRRRRVPLPPEPQQRTRRPRTPRPRHRVLQPRLASLVRRPARLRTVLTRGPCSRRSSKAPAPTRTSTSAGPTRRTRRSCTAA